MSVDASRPATVLIADDHKLFASSLAATLSMHFDVVGTVCDLDAIAPAIQELSPLVVLLDLSFHGKSAFPLLRELCASNGAVSHIIVLTGHESTALESAAMKAGAFGYIRKGSAVEDLLQVIRAALSGYHGPTTKETQIPRQPQGPAYANIDGFLLSPRQVQVLYHMLSGETRKEIADHLGITVRTVDFHIDAAKKVIGLPTSRALMVWASECQGRVSAAYKVVSAGVNPSAPSDGKLVE